MGLLSNIFKLGEIKLDKNYCMTTKEMKNIDPSLFPNVFPIWNTDENCLYMLYRQDNGKTKLECFKEMEWLDDPVVLYPIIDENGKLTWELNYLSKEEIDKIPEINIIGKSAYEIWKDLGNEGTEEEFINSLKAIDGQDGKDGQTPIIEVGDNGNWFVNGIDTGAEAKGDKGDKGDPGDTPFIGNNGNWYVSGRDTLMPARGEKGQDGKSAYNIWRSLAPENALKTEDDFINSLRGTNGIDGTTPTIGDNGHWFIGDEDTGIPVRGATGEKGNPGEDGRDGKSAYEIWLSNGNEGTKDDFLGTLKGQDGTTPTIGDNGNWFIDERDTSIRAVAVDGQDGQDGKSAYEIWKDLDESNTKKNEFEFIESLKGETGDKGDSGASGKSAYEIWKELGNEGSEEDFISSLHGKDGTAAVTPSISPSGNWFIGTQDTGILARGTNGKDGESAYEVWKAIEGNEDKTEEDFINSLKGDNGKDGTNGKDGESAYEAWKREGNEGTEEEFIESLRGDQGLSAYEVWRTVEGNENKSKEDYIESLKGDKGDQGLSAYEVWLANGNEGIESDFINYLKGIDGKTPNIGDNGNWFIDGIDTGIQVTGDKGLDGIDGQDGIDGVTPNIGDNGNWFIGDFDTGIPSTGAQGNQGLSAYEVWRTVEGNEDKTEDEYIESLKGEKGDQGEKGNDGKSAYIVWLENGNSGSEEDFIEYLKGKDAQKTAILNMFDELPTSLNVNMSDPSIINRITYFMATSSVTEGKPPIDCMIINLSWYSGYGGTQLGVGMYSNPRMFIRVFNNGSGGWDNKWLEFLTTGNISDTGYIDNTHPPELPVDFRLPYVGTPYSDDVSGIYRDLYSFVKKHKTGFYTILFDDSWYNVLSLRHRNGYSDGINYGLIIYCRMTDLSGDLCWARQAGVDKNETVRILLDSKNYASRIFPITHGNEVNHVYNIDSRSGDYIWINYRDAKGAPASRPITEYYFGNGSQTFAYAGIVCSHIRAVVSNKTSITTSVSTGTYLSGAKGEKVAINMIAAAGFNMIARVKSTNGQFIFGCYNGDFQLYYMSGNLINTNTNSYTHGITLMNENGHMLPLKNNLQDIGSTGYKWRYVYVKAVYADYIYNGIDPGTQISLGTQLALSAGTDVLIDSSFRKTDITNSITLRCINGDNLRFGVKLQAYSSAIDMYFEPTRDNIVNLGGSSTRWKQLFASTSTISTSDRREKKNISYMGSYSNEDTYMSDDTLQDFIRGLLPCIYLRIDGDSGRPHHGLISQDVEELLKKLGIKDHAGFIKSPKTETIEIEEEVEEEYVDEADGQTKTRTVILKREEQREIPGEYIYGLRYEEFIADIVRFVQLQDEELEAVKQKVVEQEEKINKQEEQLLKQQEEINELKVKMEKIEKLLNN